MNAARFALSFLLFSAPVLASTIVKCGVYAVEGRLTRDAAQDRLILVVEKGSNSEIEFDLGKAGTRFQHEIDTNVSLEIQVDQPCQYRCHGKIVEFKRALEPDERTEPFVFPKPSPLKETKCVGSVSFSRASGPRTR